MGVYYGGAGCFLRVEVDGTGAEGRATVTGVVSCYLILKLCLNAVCFQTFLSYSSTNVISHFRHKLPGNFLSTCSWGFSVLRTHYLNLTLSPTRRLPLLLSIYLKYKFWWSPDEPQWLFFSSFVFFFLFFSSHRRHKVFQARIGYFLVDSVPIPCKDGYLATLKICRFPDNRNNWQLSLDQLFTSYISE